jgi:hypothetical protein
VPVVVVTADVMMPGLMAMAPSAAMIAVLETVTAGAVIEITGLRGAHRKAECGSDYQCGQAFGEHVSLLS